MNPILRRGIHGALGGAIGAGCMTVLRMLAVRHGLIRQMIPQAVEAWAQHHAPLALSPLPSQRAIHHLADQVLHVGYGASFGAAYGAVFGQQPATTAKVMAFGTGVWAFGSFVLLPALEIARAEWRAKPIEVAVNLASHLLYAAALGLVTDEFEKQAAFQPTAYPLSLVVKTG